MRFDIVQYGFCTDKSQVKLDSIAPIERRKMSLSAKFIYTSIIGFDTLNIPLVFATNLGEINRCVTLLSELSRNQIVSPNSFSLSVLNAPIANIAIQRNIHNEILALSSHCPVECATISALSKLNSYPQVCVLAYEESFFENKQKCVAFILQKGENTQLSIKQQAGTNKYASTENFINNKGSNFCYFDDDMCYEWNFYADS